MIEKSKIVELNYTKTQQQIIYIFLFLWFLTMPVRNNILTITVQGIEIYSNLMITVLLFFSIIKSVFYFTKLQLVIISFLGAWAAYGVVHMGVTGVSQEAVFDVHSLVMQFLYAFILFGLTKIIEWAEFKKIIRNGLRFYLGLLLVFGFFEFLTQQHIVGPNVLKLTEYPISSTIYAPFFIYDNNNDYCTYILLLTSFLYFFDDYLRNNKTLLLLLVFIIFFFAQFAQSRMVELICYVYFLLAVISEVKPFWKSWKNKMSYLYVLSFIAVLGALIVSNSFFDGHTYMKSPESHLPSLVVINDAQDSIVPYNKISGERKAELKRLFETYQPEESKSVNTRLNLLKNGVEMIKNHPVLGAGPGSFRLYHKEGKFSYDTGTISNPHNFVIEIIAQFGVWGWMYFGCLLYLIWNALKSKIITCDFKIALVGLILLYPLIGLIPSSFLYINLHWLFLPLSICMITGTTLEQGKNNGY